MRDDIEQYRKRLRYEDKQGTTTRFIVVEDALGFGFLVRIYEFRPTKVKNGGTSGYVRSLIFLEWFVTVAEAIDVARASFRSSVNEGFHEVISDAGC